MNYNLLSYSFFIPKKIKTLINQSIFCRQLKKCYKYTKNYKKLDLNKQLSKQILKTFQRNTTLIQKLNGLLNNCTLFYFDRSNGLLKNDIQINSYNHASCGLFDSTLNLIISGLTLISQKSHNCNFFPFNVFNNCKKELSVYRQRKKNIQVFRL